MIELTPEEARRVLDWYEKSGTTDEYDIQLAERIGEKLRTWR